MCGIAGFTTRRSPDPIVLERMVDALTHRGPDSAGFFRSGRYCAGMRRLSINDVDGGDQPLYDESGSVVLLYNGEIYNSPQLRRDLQAEGYTFRTRSDGEVICHLYHEHGEDLFEHLDGMFAAALWIEPEQKLILARDIPGEKPLYFARLPDDGVAFASELGSLARFPGLDLSIDRQALWDFPTFAWIPEPRTVYRGVEALEPAHILIATERGIRVRRYRNPFNAAPLPASERDVV
ncbi:MAG: asparagine synthetase B, partial [Armatimonadetes bacterium]|nr:asparagine synthetase B [Armatimonadota bacterium]